MLTDQKEIEIISKAKQKNVRDPKRSREHFYRIFSDFLYNKNFVDKDFIDLGAGQFDFAEIVREKKGNCVGIDSDPAVLELGRYKGFEAIEAKINKLMDYKIDRKFDGVFNKFSINAFWCRDDDDTHKALIKSLVALIKEDGWSWIAPWNGIPASANLSEDRIIHILEFQKNQFIQLGFDAIEISKEDAIYYGINGSVANNIIFTKNLKFEKH
ncbi:MAG: hypothetical protein C0603_09920 [Denitrovibrio sp.]|nr:MAG: hypothetical protein C0603_09920 [Denitrovibrio sp.]